MTILTNVVHKWLLRDNSNKCCGWCMTSPWLQANFAVGTYSSATTLKRHDLFVKIRQMLVQQVWHPVCQILDRNCTKQTTDFCPNILENCHYLTMTTLLSLSQASAKTILSYCWHFCTVWVTFQDASVFLNILIFFCPLYLWQQKMERKWHNKFLSFLTKSLEKKNIYFESDHFHSFL